jgi:hypothetical protein
VQGTVGTSGGIRATRCGIANNPQPSHAGLSASKPSVFYPSNGGGRGIFTGPVILLLVLAPLLQGLGIEVHHRGTFLARLAFTLIGLAAFGFHLCPSLPTAAWHTRSHGAFGSIRPKVDVETHFHFSMLVRAPFVKSQGNHRSRLSQSCPKRGSGANGRRSIYHTLERVKSG